MAQTVLTPFNMSGLEVRDVRAETVGSLPDISTAPLKAYNAGRYVYFSNGLWYCDGTVWVELGSAGAGGPPSGTASGDLSGTYPSPQIATGVIVDADINGAANIATSKIAGLDAALTGKVATTRSVIAGNGLTGGGTLAADVTLNVVGDATLTVSADSMTVVSAPKWTTGRTITLTGDTTGVSGAFDGSANLSFATVGVQAAKWTTGRTVSLTGDVTGTSGAFDGSANLSFATALGAGVIVDADVNSGAAIAQSKIATLTTDLAARVLKAGDTMGGYLTANADPTNPLHYATKQYVDLASQGFSFKNAVRLVATTNQTLTGAATIDGIAVVTNDRILCTAQTTTSQNGIYLANTAGAWTRATDMDANGELIDGTLVPVAAGTAGADSQYMCTSIAATPWVVGSTASTWTRFSGLSDLQAGTGLTKTGNTVDFIAGDASLTVAADSVIVASAPKWTTGRTITLTGDVTGASAAFDGTAALSFATTLTAGIIVDADVNATANIAQSKILNLTTDLAARVPTTRSVIAGNGLTGGGALSADVTLNFVGDANLSVAADAVSVLSAPKWTTARSISLTGDVTGTVASVDGTANVSIATTVVGGANLAKQYAADVGAGTAVVINHALATRDVSVEVYRNSTPWDTVICDVERTDTNNVTLRFATAVTAAAYRVVVQGR